MNNLLKLFAIVVGLGFVMLLIYMTAGLQPWILALGALIFAIAGSTSFVLLLKNNKNWDHGH